MRRIVCERFEERKCISEELHFSIVALAPSGMCLWVEKVGVEFVTCCPFLEVQGTLVGCHAFVLQRCINTVLSNIVLSKK